MLRECSPTPRREGEGLLRLGEANVFLKAIDSLLEWPEPLIDVLSDVIHQSADIAR
jgi:hypothetical protein